MNLRSDLVGSTWEAVSRDAVLLVPVGALQQHGPHLPLDTDTVIAEAVTAGVTGRLEEDGLPTWVAPALAYASSGEHQAFPGTISIGAEALHLVLVELVRSACTWAGRVVLVNAHGGNEQTLVRAVDQLVSEGHDVMWLPCRTERVDLHAGRTETSLMLHLQPEAVRTDQAMAGDTRPLTEILDELLSGGVGAVYANGVLGDPTGANAREGANVLTAMIEEVRGAVLTRSDVPA